MRRRSRRHCLIGSWHAAYLKVIPTDTCKSPPAKRHWRKATLALCSSSIVEWQLPTSTRQESSCFIINMIYCLLRPVASNVCAPTCPRIMPHTHCTHGGSLLGPDELDERQRAAEPPADVLRPPRTNQLRTSAASLAGRLLRVCACARTHARTHACMHAQPTNQRPACRLPLVT